VSLAAEAQEPARCLDVAAVNVASRLIPGSCRGGRRSNCALYDLRALRPASSVWLTGFVRPSFRQSESRTLTVRGPGASHRERGATGRIQLAVEEAGNQVRTTVLMVRQVGGGCDPRVLRAEKCIPQATGPRPDTEALWRPDPAW